MDSVDQLVVRWLVAGQVSVLLWAPPQPVRTVMMKTRRPQPLRTDDWIWNVILYNDDKVNARMLDAERKVCKTSVFTPLANWISWTSAFRPASWSVRNR